MSDIDLCHANEEERINALYICIQNLLNDARNNVARSVNTEMVNAYWFIGKAIVEEEQHGANRAEYGAKLLKIIGQKMALNYGKGFGITILKYVRQFYLTYATAYIKTGDSTIRHAVRGESEPRPNKPKFNPNLSWTHYRILCKVKIDKARSFYEVEADSNRWSYRELERQINSCLFERLRSNSATNAIGIAKSGHTISKPSDILKDPFIFEFLGLPESHKLVESKLEDALITHLRKFLLELGKGFAFIARQQRISLDGDHFYIDLVFYHAILKCYVLIDLKTKKISHSDLGQMLMYVNYYDMECVRAEDNPTIGLILCAEKNDAMVKYALGDRATQIFASKYQLHMPTVDELQQELRRELDVFLNQELEPA